MCFQEFGPTMPRRLIPTILFAVQFVFCAYPAPAQSSSSSSSCPCTLPAWPRRRAFPSQALARRRHLLPRLRRNRRAPRRSHRQRPLAGGGFTPPQLGTPRFFVPPVFRIVFQVPYALTPLFLTLRK